MSLRRALIAVSFAAGLLGVSREALAADLILNGQTVSLGGVQTYGVVSLTNGSRINVLPYDGVDKVATGSLVIKASSITIDATSSIRAKGSGYQAALCLNGPGPMMFGLSGGRGGCGVRDSGGGGAHFGIGGRGTKDAPASFPAGYEEDCIGAVSGGACTSTSDCRNNDGLPSVAGQPFFHSIYAAEFGAAGGDKGCRDGDGFVPSAGTTVALTGGDGGGRIVLFAANAGQTGTLTVNGTINANGMRGCASGNDSAGGGAGGTVLLIGDTVNIGATARVLAAGGRGGDSQPKCLPCAANADCGGTGQTCVAGRCAPCNCTPCTSNAQCDAALGQTCKNLGGALGSVCANASNQCTPFDPTDNEVECVGTQISGTCDDCGGGGGGGIINVLSRVSTISPIAQFNVSGANGGVCPICTGEAGGGAGELQIDGAYVGEVCDGFDNDFDGSTDNGLPMLACPGGAMIASCVNGVPQQCPVDQSTCIQPVTDTRPRFAVVVDSSGSMLLDAQGRPTFGDGSTTHPGVDTSSDADVIAGNNSRLFIAKSALVDVLSAFPHADYALGRYHQDVSVNRSCQAASWFECQKLCCSYDDPLDNVAPLIPYPPGCNLQSIYGAGYPAGLNAQINVGWPNQSDCINYAGSCGPPRRGADFLVGFGKPLQQQLKWLDGKETSFQATTTPGDHCSFSSGGDCELRGSGPTPLAASLQAAEDFLKPTILCDGAVQCRDYAVILLTDGAESCQGNPVAAATALRNSVKPITGTEIKTYVIGFSTLPSETAQLNAIASAGGTGSAFLATDQSTLANALATIIASSTDFEQCNNLDDDCDTLIDEDFPDKGQACDDGKLGVCKGTGARICNASGTGTICQIVNPGLAPSAEVCNGLDDNCNGLIDEGGICQQCVPTSEVCNNIDDNCNAAVDDNPIDANQPCGLSVGECSPGTTVCMPGGMLVCSGGVGPVPEACNGLDDDCNGVVDGITRPCYTGPAVTKNVGVCLPGSQPCTAAPGSGMEQWGACVGEVTPTTEICDGLDNDCDGAVDDQVPDGLGHVTGDFCCQYGTKCGVGVCTFGAYACAGSQVVCAGGVGPSAEVCDGLDNDCNGATDDLPGKGAPCILPGGCPGVLDCGPNGSLVCVSGAQGVEVCNGLDDDCDGSIDEEPDVSQNDPAIGVVCDAPMPPSDQPPCKSGISVCKEGAPACNGSVTPSAEVCDGIDNDCNGAVDTPNPCPGEQLCIEGQCRSKCKTSGEFPCPGGEFCVDGYCVPENQTGAGGGGGAGTGVGTGVGGGAGVGGGSSGSMTGAGGGQGGAGGGHGDAVGAGGAGKPRSDDVYGLPTGGGGFLCALSDGGARAPGGGALLMAAAGLGAAIARRRRNGAKEAR
jgi:hypothetical protein